MQVTPPKTDAVLQEIPQEVLVQFRDDTGAARIDAILEALPSVNRKSLGSPFVYSVALPSNVTVDQAIERLVRFPEVLHANPNRLTPPAPRGVPGNKPNNSGLQR